MHKSSGNSHLHADYSADRHTATSHGDCHCDCHGNAR